MPIFVEWEWKESTKSFLVIFHFIDDYSEKNLRLKQKCLHKSLGKQTVYRISSFGSTPTHPVMTWAPSHVESALISQILCYANIVNGFNEETKRLLRYLLEVTIVRREKKTIEVAVGNDFKKMLKGKAFILGLEPTKERDDFEQALFCCQLSTEYVEYIWKILKTTLTEV